MSIDIHLLYICHQLIWCREVICFGLDAINNSIDNFLILGFDATLKLICIHLIIQGHLTFRIGCRPNMWIKFAIYGCRYYLLIRVYLPRGVWTFPMHELEFTCFLFSWGDVLLR